MNTNIEELYKKKYLKYKSKYLNIQRGGRFTQGRNHPNHIAFIDKDKLPESIPVGGKAGFMALDDKGNIAVTDTINNSVKVFNLRDNKLIKSYILPKMPTGIAFDNDKIYIVRGNEVEFDDYNINPDSKNTLEWQIRNSVLGISSAACNVEYVYTVGENGITVYEKSKKNQYNLYSDQSLPIQEIRCDKGTLTGQFTDAKSIAFDRAGNIVVADTGNNRIQVIEKIPKPSYKDLSVTLVTDAFRIIGKGKGNGPGQFNNPTDFAFNVHGQIIVADTGNNRVQILDYKTGVPISQYSITQPAGIVVDGNGRILVSTGNIIQALDRSKFRPFP